MKNKLLGSLVVCICLSAMLMACAPTYDNIADQMLADTQKQADDGFLNLETLGHTIESLKHSSNPDDKNSLAEAEKQAVYSSNMGFYNKVESSIIALDTRITSMPDASTPKITEALSQIETSVNNARDLHAKQNTLSSDFSKLTRQQLDQQFKALTVYELTIKNGKTPK